MNTQEYINSGVLEMYSLNLLDSPEKAEVEKMISSNPLIKEEYENIQLTLEAYARTSAIQPKPHVKDRIFNVISNLEKEHEMNLENLPVLNRFSDHKAWMHLVGDYIPEQLEDGRFSKVLNNSSDLTQVLLVSTSDFDEEVHTDEHESFLILSGTCKCTVGDQVYYMKAGDFMEIPLHTHHTVEIQTQVIAIMQRIAV